MPYPRYLVTLLLVVILLLDVVKAEQKDAKTELAPMDKRRMQKQLAKRLCYSPTEFLTTGPCVDGNDSGDVSSYGDSSDSYGDSYATVDDYSDAYPTDDGYGDSYPMDGGGDEYADDSYPTDDGYASDSYPVDDGSDCPDDGYADDSYPVDDESSADDSYAVDDGTYDNYGPPADTGCLLGCHCIVVTDPTMLCPDEALACADDLLTCGYDCTSSANIVCPGDLSSAVIYFDDPSTGTSHIDGVQVGAIAGAFCATGFVDQVSVTPGDSAAFDCYYQ